MEPALVDVGRVGEVVRTDVQLLRVGVQQQVQRLARGGELGGGRVRDGPRGDVDTLAAPVAGVLAGEGDGYAHVLRTVAGGAVVGAGDDGAGHLGAVEAVALLRDLDLHVEGPAGPEGLREIALVRVARGHDPL